MPPPLNWITDLRQVLATQSCVLVTLRIVSGSAPRESGSRMIVTREEMLGSIGGGNLEFKAMEKARSLLGHHAEASQEYELYGLGPALNQCCGGAVAVLFEALPKGVPEWLEQLHRQNENHESTALAMAVDAAIPIRHVIEQGSPPHPGLPADVHEAALDLLSEEQDATGGFEELPLDGEKWWIEKIQEAERRVLLFGAGHVGQAVARALAPLPFRVTWIDSREGVFPEKLPANIQALQTEDPAAEAARTASGSIFVVMTHSHQVDEDICLEVLRRDDFAWLGLIGSETKRRRFVHRLEQRGVEPPALERLVCPIGLDSIHGKQPATIALSLAAQLMTPGFASRHQVTGKN